MSSFYEDASLVMIPSGYKTSKVYCAKPTDGAGDLTFTRSNDTATRVNSAGLIEKVRTNLILQSEAFDNASWSKTTATVTANTTTAPNGTTTADTFDSTGSFAFLSQSPTLGSGSLATYSVYIKNIDAPYVNLQVRSTITAGLARFNFTGATLTGSTLTTGISANFTDVGSGWYRCTLTCTTSEVNQQYRIQLPNSGDSVFVWGAMAEVGDVMTDYIPTTSAAVSVGPVANVPRLDYLNSSCPRLLLEPQATALNTYSEQLDNAAWTKANLTITSNQSNSPTGYSDADSLAEQAVNGIHYAGQGITSAAAGTYTFSCFLKQGTTQYGGFRAVVNGFTNRYFVLLDLSNGSVVNTNTTASGVTWTHKVDNYGNGWYRLSITAAHTSGNIDVSISTSDTATPTYFGGLPTYLGTNKFIYAWGANITATAYPQSYIPTLGAAVTRGADSMTKSAISGLIGQTEGVIFMDFVYSTPEQTRININSGSSQNWVFFGAPESVTNSRVYIRASGIVSVDTTTNLTGVFVVGQRYKVALAYKSGDWAIAINGTIRTSGTQTFTFNAPLTTAIFSGNVTSEPSAQQGTNNVNQALLFKTRLSNSELSALTTL